MTLSSDKGDPRGIAAGDLDGDGVADIAVAFAAAGTLAWYKADRSASGATTFTENIISDNYFDVFAVEFLDADGDGRLDILTASRLGNSIALWQNTAEFPHDPPIWTFVEIDVGSGVAGAFSLAIGDINGDGKPDFVSAHRDSNSIALYTNVYNGGSPVFTRQV